MSTKTLIVPEEHLERMLAQWLDKQGGDPEFREAKCWSCGRPVTKMWHVFFRGGQREAHLCIDCGKPYEHRLVASYVGGHIQWHVKPTGLLRKKLRDLMEKLDL